MRIWAVFILINIIYQTHVFTAPVGNSGSATQGGLKTKFGKIADQIINPKWTLNDPDLKKEKNDLNPSSDTENTNDENQPNTENNDKKIRPKKNNKARRKKSNNKRKSKNIKQNNIGHNGRHRWYKMVTVDYLLGNLPEYRNHEDEQNIVLIWGDGDERKIVLNEHVDALSVKNLNNNQLIRKKRDYNNTFQLQDKIQTKNVIQQDLKENEKDKLNIEANINKNSKEVETQNKKLENKQNFNNKKTIEKYRGPKSFEEELSLTENLEDDDNSINSNSIENTNKNEKFLNLKNLNQNKFRHIVKKKKHPTYTFRNKLDHPNHSETKRSSLKTVKRNPENLNHVPIISKNVPEFTIKENTDTTTNIPGLNKIDTIMDAMNSNTDENLVDQTNELYPFSLETKLGIPNYSDIEDNNEKLENRYKHKLNKPLNVNNIKEKGSHQIAVKPNSSNTKDILMISYDDPDITTEVEADITKNTPESDEINTIMNAKKSNSSENLDDQINDSYASSLKINQEIPDYSDIKDIKEHDILNKIKNPLKHKSKKLEKNQPDHTDKLPKKLKQKLTTPLEPNNENVKESPQKSITSLPAPNLNETPKKSTDVPESTTGGNNQIITNTPEPDEIDTIMNAMNSNSSENLDDQINDSYTSSLEINQEIPDYSDIKDIKEHDILNKIKNPLKHKSKKLEKNRPDHTDKLPKKLKQKLTTPLEPNNENVKESPQKSITSLPAPNLNETPKKSTDVPESTTGGNNQIITNTPEPDEIDTIMNAMNSNSSENLDDQINDSYASSLEINQEIPDYSDIKDIKEQDILNKIKNPLKHKSKKLEKNRPDHTDKLPKKLKQKLTTPLEPNNENVKESPQKSITSLPAPNLNKTPKKSTDVPESTTGGNNQIITNTPEPDEIDTIMNAMNSNSSENLDDQINDSYASSLEINQEIPDNSDIKDIKEHDILNKIKNPLKHKSKKLEKSQPDNTDKLPKKLKQKLTTPLEPNNENVKESPQKSITSLPAPNLNETPKKSTDVPESTTRGNNQIITNTPEPDEIDTIMNAMNSNSSENLDDQINDSYASSLEINQEIPDYSDIKDIKEHDILNKIKNPLKHKSKKLERNQPDHTDKLPKKLKQKLNTPLEPNNENVKESPQKSITSLPAPNLNETPKKSTDVPESTTGGNNQIITNTPEPDEIDTIMNAMNSNSSENLDDQINDSYASSLEINQEIPDYSDIKDIKEHDILNKIKNPLKHKSKKLEKNQPDHTDKLPKKLKQKLNTPLEPNNENVKESPQKSITSLPAPHLNETPKKSTDVPESTTGGNNQIITNTPEPDEIDTIMNAMNSNSSENLDDQINDSYASSLEINQEIPDYSDIKDIKEHDILNKTKNPLKHKSKKLEKNQPDHTDKLPKKLKQKLTTPLEPNNENVKESPQKSITSLPAPNLNETPKKSTDVPESTTGGNNQIITNTPEPDEIDTIMNAMNSNSSENLDDQINDSYASSLEINQEIPDYSDIKDIKEHDILNKIKNPLKHKSKKLEKNQPDHTDKLPKKLKQKLNTPLEPNNENVKESPQKSITSLPAPNLNETPKKSTDVPESTTGGNNQIITNTPEPDEIDTIMNAMNSNSSENLDDQINDSYASSLEINQEIPDYSDIKDIKEHDILNKTKNPLKHKSKKLEKNQPDHTDKLPKKLKQKLTTPLEPNNENVKESPQKSITSLPAPNLNETPKKSTDVPESTTGGNNQIITNTPEPDLIDTIMNAMNSNSSENLENQINDSYASSLEINQEIPDNSDIKDIKEHDILNKIKNPLKHKSKKLEKNQPDHTDKLPKKLKQKLTTPLEPNNENVKESPQKSITSLPAPNLNETPKKSTDVPESTTGGNNQIITNTPEPDEIDTIMNAMNSNSSENLDDQINDSYASSLEINQEIPDYSDIKDIKEHDILNKIKNPLKPKSKKLEKNQPDYTDKLPKKHKKKLDFDDTPEKTMEKNDDRFPSSKGNKIESQIPNDNIIQNILEKNKSVETSTSIMETPHKKHDTVSNKYDVPTRYSKTPSTGNSDKDNNIVDISNGYDNLGDMTMEDFDLKNTEVESPNTVDQQDTNLTDKNKLITNIIQNTIAHPYESDTGKPVSDDEAVNHKKIDTTIPSIPKVDEQILKGIIDNQKISDLVDQSFSSSIEDLINSKTDKDGNDMTSLDFDDTPEKTMEKNDDRFPSSKGNKIESQIPNDNIIQNILEKNKSVETSTSIMGTPHKKHDTVSNKYDVPTRYSKTPSTGNSDKDNNIVDISNGYDNLGDMTMEDFDLKNTEVESPNTVDQQDTNLTDKNKLITNIIQNTIAHPYESDTGKPVSDDEAVNHKKIDTTIPSIPKVDEQILKGIIDNQKISDLVDQSFSSSIEDLINSKTDKDGNDMTSLDFDDTPEKTMEKNDDRFPSSKGNKIESQIPNDNIIQNILEKNKSVETSTSIMETPHKKHDTVSNKYDVPTRYSKTPSTGNSDKDNNIVDISNGYDNLGDMTMEDFDLKNTEVESPNTVDQQDTNLTDKNKLITNIIQNTIAHPYESDTGKPVSDDEAVNHKKIDTTIPSIPKVDEQILKGIIDNQKISDLVDQSFSSSIEDLINSKTDKDGNDMTSLDFDDTPEKTMEKNDDRFPSSKGNKIESQIPNDNIIQNILEKNKSVETSTSIMETPHKKHDTVSNKYDVPTRYSKTPSTGNSDKDNNIVDISNGYDNLGDMTMEDFDLKNTEVESPNTVDQQDTNLTDKNKLITNIIQNTIAHPYESDTGKPVSDDEAVNHKKIDTTIPSIPKVDEQILKGIIDNQKISDLVDQSFSSSIEDLINSKTDKDGNDMTSLDFDDTPEKTMEKNDDRFPSSKGNKIESQIPNDNIIQNILEKNKSVETSSPIMETPHKKHDTVSNKYDVPTRYSKTPSTGNSDKDNNIVDISNGYDNLGDMTMEDFDLKNTEVESPNTVDQQDTNLTDKNKLITNIIQNTIAHPYESDTGKPVSDDEAVNHKKIDTTIPSIPKVDEQILKGIIDNQKISVLVDQSFSSSIEDLINSKTDKDGNDMTSLDFDDTPEKTMEKNDDRFPSSKGNKIESQIPNDNIIQNILEKNKSVETSTSIMETPHKKHDTVSNKYDVPTRYSKTPSTGNSDKDNNIVDISNGYDNLGDMTMEDFDLKNTEVESPNTVDQQDTNLTDKNKLITNIIQNTIAHPYESDTGKPVSDDEAVNHKKIDTTIPSIPKVDEQILKGIIDNQKISDLVDQSFSSSIEDLINSKTDKDGNDMTSLDFDDTPEKTMEKNDDRFPSSKGNKIESQIPNDNIIQNILEKNKSVETSSPIMETPHKKHDTVSNKYDVPTRYSKTPSTGNSDKDNNIVDISNGYDNLGDMTMEDFDLKNTEVESPNTVDQQDTNLTDKNKLITNIIQNTIAHPYESDTGKPVSDDEAVNHKKIDTTIPSIPKVDEQILKGIIDNQKISDLVDQSFSSSIEDLINSKTDKDGNDMTSLDFDDTPEKTMEKNDDRFPSSKGNKIESQIPNDNIIQNILEKNKSVETSSPIMETPHKKHDTVSNKYDVPTRYSKTPSTGNSDKDNNIVDISNGYDNLGDMTMEDFDLKNTEVESPNTVDQQDTNLTDKNKLITNIIQNTIAHPYESDTGKPVSDDEAVNHKKIDTTIPSIPKVDEQILKGIIDNQKISDLVDQSFSSSIEDLINSKTDKDGNDMTSLDFDDTPEKTMEKNDDRFPSSKGNKIESQIPNDNIIQNILEKNKSVETSSPIMETPHKKHDTVSNKYDVPTRYSKTPSTGNSDKDNNIVDISNGYDNLGDMTMEDFDLKNTEVESPNTVDQQDTNLTDKNKLITNIIQNTIAHPYESDTGKPVSDDEAVNHKKIDTTIPSIPKVDEQILKGIIDNQKISDLVDQSFSSSIEDLINSKTDKDGNDMTSLDYDDTPEKTMEKNDDRFPSSKGNKIESQIPNDNIIQNILEKNKSVETSSPIMETPHKKHDTVSNKYDVPTRYSKTPSTGNSDKDNNIVDISNGYDNLGDMTMEDFDLKNTEVESPNTVDQQDTNLTDKNKLITNIIQNTIAHPYESDTGKPVSDDEAVNHKKIDTTIPSIPKVDEQILKGIIDNQKISVLVDQSFSSSIEDLINSKTDKDGNDMTSLDFDDTPEKTMEKNDDRFPSSKGNKIESQIPNDNIIQNILEKNKSVETSTSIMETPHKKHDTVSNKYDVPTRYSKTPSTGNSDKDNNIVDISNGYDNLGDMTMEDFDLKNTEVESPNTVDQQDTNLTDKNKLITNIIQNTIAHPYESDTGKPVSDDEAVNHKKIDTTIPSIPKVDEQILKGIIDNQKISDLVDQSFSSSIEDLINSKTDKDGNDMTSLDFDDTPEKTMEKNDDRFPSSKGNKIESQIPNDNIIQNILEKNKSVEISSPIMEAPHKKHDTVSNKYDVPTRYSKTPSTGNSDKDNNIVDISNGYDNLGDMTMEDFDLKNTEVESPNTVDQQDTNLTDKNKLITNIIQNTIAHPYESDTGKPVSDDEAVNHKKIDTTIPSIPKVDEQILKGIIDNQKISDLVDQSFSSSIEDLINSKTDKDGNDMTSLDFDDTPEKTMEKNDDRFPSSKGNKIESQIPNDNIIQNILEKNKSVEISSPIMEAPHKKHDTVSNKYDVPNRYSKTPSTGNSDKDNNIVDISNGYDNLGDMTMEDFDLKNTEVKSPNTVDQQDTNLTDKNKLIPNIIQNTMTHPYKSDTGKPVSDDEAVNHKKIDTTIPRFPKVDEQILKGINDNHKISDLVDQSFSSSIEDLINSKTDKDGKDMTSMNFDDIPEKTMEKNDDRFPSSKGNKIGFQIPNDNINQNILEKNKSVETSSPIMEAPHKKHDTVSNKYDVPNRYSKTPSTGNSDKDNNIVDISNGYDNLGGMTMEDFDLKNTEVKSPNTVDQQDTNLTDKNKLIPNSIQNTFRHPYESETGMRTEDSDINKTVVKLPNRPINHKKNLTGNNILSPTNVHKMILSGNPENVGFISNTGQYGFKPNSLNSKVSIPNEHILITNNDEDPSVLNTTDNLINSLFEDDEEINVNRGFKIKPIMDYSKYLPEDQNQKIQHNPIKQQYNEFLRPPSNTEHTKYENLKEFVKTKINNDTFLLVNDNPKMNIHNQSDINYYYSNHIHKLTKVNEDSNMYHNLSAIVTSDDDSPIISDNNLMNEHDNLYGYMLPKFSTKYIEVDDSNNLWETVPPKKNKDFSIHKESDNCNDDINQSVDYSKNNIILSHVNNDKKIIAETETVKKSFNDKGNTDIHNKIYDDFIKKMSEQLFKKIDNIDEKISKLDKLSNNNTYITQSYNIRCDDPDANKTILMNDLLISNPKKGFNIEEPDSKIKKSVESHETLMSNKCNDKIEIEESLKPKKDEHIKQKRNNKKHKNHSKHDRHKKKKTYKKSDKHDNGEDGDNDDDEDDDIDDDNDDDDGRLKKYKIHKENDKKKHKKNKGRKKNEIIDNDVDDDDDDDDDYDDDGRVKKKIHNKNYIDDDVEVSQSKKTGNKKKKKTKVNISSREINEFNNSSSLQINSEDNDSVKGLKIKRKSKNSNKMNSTKSKKLLPKNKLKHSKSIKHKIKDISVDASDDDSCSNENNYNLEETYIKTGRNNNQNNVPKEKMHKHKRRKHIKHKKPLKTSKTYKYREIPVDNEDNITDENNVNLEETYSINITNDDNALKLKRLKHKRLKKMKNIDINIVKDTDNQVLNRDTNTRRGYQFYTIYPQYRFTNPFARLFY